MTLEAMADMENQVFYYQDRDSDSTLLKLVQSGKDAGLYLWQIGPQAWKKLEGKEYEVFSNLVYSPANHRVLSEERAKEEIKKLGTVKK